MKIIDIDFDDPVFRNCFEEYYVNSSPMEISSSKSISRRRDNSDYYLKFLKKKCTLNHCSVDDNGDYVYFSFSSIKKEPKTGKDYVHVYFVFNNRLNFFSPEMVVKNAYAIWNHQLEVSGLDFCGSSILRINKRLSFIKFIKRYVKAAEFLDKDNFAIVRKERIKEEYEKI